MQEMMLDELDAKMLCNRSFIIPAQKQNFFAGFARDQDYIPLGTLSLNVHFGKSSKSE